MLPTGLLMKEHQLIERMVKFLHGIFYGRRKGSRVERILCF